MPRKKYLISIKDQLLLLRSMSPDAAAYLNGIKRRSFMDNRSDCPKNDDGSYDARDVVEYILLREKPLPPEFTSDSEDIEDPDMAIEGDDSIDNQAKRILTKYRKEKYLQARLERKRTEGDLINRDDVKLVLKRLCYRLKEMIRLLQKEFGNKVIDIADDCIDSFESDVESEVGKVRY